MASPNRPIGVVKGRNYLLYRLLRRNSLFVRLNFMAMRVLEVTQ